MAPYVIAVTGASAQPIAERAIQLLLRKDSEIELILSKGAYEVWNKEIGITIPVDPKKQEVFWRNRLKESKGRLCCHRWNDHSAAIASGSFKTKGMAIVPCTMGTIGRVSAGFSLDLIERCADVHLKESRKLVVAPRETPWSIIHLRNLTNLAESGATIFPLIPAWYTKPTGLEELIDFLVVRLFDAFDEDLSQINRWEGC